MFCKNNNIINEETTIKIARASNPNKIIENLLTKTTKRFYFKDLKNSNELFNKLQNPKNNFALEIFKIAEENKNIDISYVIDIFYDFLLRDLKMDKDLKNLKFPLFNDDNLFFFVLSSKNFYNQPIIKNENSSQPNWSVFLGKYFDKIIKYNVVISDEFYNFIKKFSGVNFLEYNINFGTNQNKFDTFFQKLTSIYNSQKISQKLSKNIKTTKKTKKVKI